ncbi:Shedu immune nuclease family protein [Lysinibacillus sp. NPDC097279]|uniref:Shedu immune nuclease family protein n=1 Tax=Lysinibacillus sp. NPDC097279 TaxID=3364143 RepID=UPI0038026DAD
MTFRDGSVLKKAYELVYDAPKAIEWDAYEKKVMDEYKILLKENADDERKFQEFFERNPSLLPGAFGIFGNSGHAPYNNALITQPLLQGLTTKIPDFLWLATDSLNIYPIFIEIEKPNKKWFRKNGQPTAEFTQAQSQLSEWKQWYDNPIHQSLFFQYYDIDREINNGRVVKPQYVLIYGSSINEFEGKPELNRKRAHLPRENEVYMTFDRLTPEFKARNTITCQVKDRNYLAKYVAPTFELGPLYAKQLNRISKKVEAINNSLIDEERKGFLVSRIGYWEKLGSEQPSGSMNTGDWE